MRVWIDNVRLTAHQPHVADVAAALRRENVDIPSGRVEGSDREFTVRTLGELHTRRGVRRADRRDGATASRSACATSRASRSAPRTSASSCASTGKPAVGLGIVQAVEGQHARRRRRRARPRSSSCSATLPAGVKLDDRLRLVDLHPALVCATCAQTIFEAIVLVVARDLPLPAHRCARRSSRRSRSRSRSSAPSRVLYFLGFTINTLTLMGLTLAIGLVVDDAIVVLENVTRWVEEGTPPREAARRGMDEISFAVVAATVSVDRGLPAARVPHRHRPAGSSASSASRSRRRSRISGFVALTLVADAVRARAAPRRRGARASSARLARAFDGARRRLRARAAAARSRAPRRRASRSARVWVVLGLVLLHVGSPREFIPTADRGTILVFTRAPEGSTHRVHRPLPAPGRGRRRSRRPEVDARFSVVALGIGTPGLVNEGAMFVEPRCRGRSASAAQQEIVDDLRGQLARRPRHRRRSRSTCRRSAATSARTPISLVIQGPTSTRSRATPTRSCAARARSRASVNVRRPTSLLNKPQLEVDDRPRPRQRPRRLGARRSRRTLQILLGGLDLSTFKLEGETYDVMAQLERGRARAARATSTALYVRGNGRRADPARARS